MNRTQKFALNSLTAMVSQVVALLVGMITPRLIIGTYGSELNGLVSSLHQFISYITLVEAGIGGAAIYSLYKPLAENDHGKISSIVVAAKKSYRQAGYLFASGILILAVVYSSLSKSDTLSFFTIFSLTVLFGVSGCVNFFIVAGDRVLLTADQKNYIITASTIIHSIVKIILLITMVWLKSDVVLLYAVTALTSLITICIISTYTRKNYKYIDKSAKPDKSAMEKRWDVIYQQILGMVQTGSPTVIATILFDLVIVSVYSVYSMVVTGLNGVLNVFISGLPAGFGELIAKNETKGLKRAVTEFEVAYYYILSVAYGLALALIMPFVKVYTAGFSDVNYIQPMLGVVIVLNGLLYNIKTPQSMLVISAGMYKETRWRVTIQGVIIIVAGVLLGLKYGVVGIVLGSCISNLYRTIDLLFFIPKHITHNSVLKTTLRMLKVVANIVLIYMPTYFMKFGITSFIEWVMLAVVWAVYALVVVTATSLIFEREYLGAVLKRVMGMLKLRRHK